MQHSSVRLWARSWTLIVQQGSRWRPGQLGGGIHIHPGGRYVYVASRADKTEDYRGRQVFAGGENSIVVFAIDQATGEPTLVQHADPRSNHVRTFSIDPGGRVMITASIHSRDVRIGERIDTLPTVLSVFRIGADGKLDYVRKYDIDAGGKLQWWMGIVPL